MFVVVVCCCCCPAVLGVVEGWGDGLCTPHHWCCIGLAWDTPPWTLPGSCNVGQLLCWGGVAHGTLWEPSHCGWKYSILDSFVAWSAKQLWILIMCGWEVTGPPFPPRGPTSSNILYWAGRLQSVYTPHCSALQAVISAESVFLKCCVLWTIRKQVDYEHPISHFLVIHIHWLCPMQWRR